MNTLFWHYRAARHALAIVLAPVVSLGLLVLLIAAWTKLGLISAVAVLTVGLLLAWHRTPRNPITSVHQWIEDWQYHWDRAVLGRWLWCTWSRTSGRIELCVTPWNDKPEKIDLAITIPLGGLCPIGFVYWEGRRLRGWGVRRFWINDERRTIAVQLSDPKQNTPYFGEIEDAIEYLRHLATVDETAWDIVKRMVNENRSLRQTNARLLGTGSKTDHRQPTPIRPLSASVS